jgi:hypothetical protein
MNELTVAQMIGVLSGLSGSARDAGRMAEADLLEDCANALELERVAAQVEPVEDMTDPANWKAGDVVECIKSRAALTKGRAYTLTPTMSGKAHDGDGDVRVRDDDGARIHYSSTHFRWVSRPQGESA